MTTIFESSARQPNPELVEAQLHDLTVVVAKQKKEHDSKVAIKKKEQTFHQFLESEYKTQVFCSYEAAMCMLGDLIKQNQYLFMAAQFILEKSGGEQGKILELVGMSRSRYAYASNKYFHSMDKSLIRGMEEKYLRLMQYFRFDIRKPIENPITVTQQSKV